MSCARYIRAWSDLPPVTQNNDSSTIASSLGDSIFIWPQTFLYTPPKPPSGQPIILHDAVVLSFADNISWRSLGALGIHCFLTFLAVYVACGNENPVTFWGRKPSEKFVQAVGYIIYFPKRTICLSGKTLRSTWMRLGLRVEG